MQQVNKWGVNISTQQITEATASIAYKTLSKGVYNALLSNFEFKDKNKAGEISPMIIVTYKIIDGDDTVDVKDWWLLTAKKGNPIVLSKIAGLCDSWGIETIHRQYINVNGTNELNPAESLKESLLEMHRYAKWANAAKNLMVGVQLDVEEREVTDDSGQKKILTSNKVKSFVEPQNIMSTPQVNTTPTLR